MLHEAKAHDEADGDGVPIGKKRQRRDCEVTEPGDRVHFTSFGSPALTETAMCGPRWVALRWRGDITRRKGDLRLGSAASSGLDGLRVIPAEPGPANARWRAAARYVRRCRDGEGD